MSLLKLFLNIWYQSRINLVKHKKQLEWFISVHNMWEINPTENLFSTVNLLNAIII